jgi:hypothetical protein
MVVATAPGVRSVADSRCLATVKSNTLGTRFKVWSPGRQIYSES